MELLSFIGVMDGWMEGGGVWITPIQCGLGPLVRLARWAMFNVMLV